MYMVYLSARSWCEVITIAHWLAGKGCMSFGVHKTSFLDILISVCSPRLRLGTADKLKRIIVVQLHYSIR